MYLQTNLDQAWHKYIHMKHGPVIEFRNYDTAKDPINESFAFKDVGIFVIFEEAIYGN